MNNFLMYEHPLNELVRSLLRLQHLFLRIDHHVELPEHWDARIGVDLLVELNELLKRSDIKSDLGAELERQLPRLLTLQDNPDVDADRLKKVIDDINEYLAAVRSDGTQPGASLDTDKLITAVKQKSVMAGGACSFDLPAYHHWLNKPPESRARDLREWQQDLLIIHKGAALMLYLIRSNVTVGKETATAGFYQKSIESDENCQLIRVALPRSSKFFPEISGGRHRFTVRFMQQTSTAHKPMQTEENVNFDLHYCIL